MRSKQFHHIDPQFRIRLNDALTSNDPAGQLTVLYHSGELTILPEITSLFDLGDANGLHKDVWLHTLNVVAGVQNNLELRWAALLHDIGKAKTRQFDERGRVTFHKHDYVGARMVDRLQSRLVIFTEQSLHTTVKSLVLNHLRPASYKASWTDSAIRRLVTDLGGAEGFERLMCLSRADLTTKVPSKRTKAMNRASALEKRVMSVLAFDNRPKLPKGTMGLILEKSGRKPGAWVNNLRSDLESDLAKGIIKCGLSVDEYVLIALKRLII